MAGSVNKVILIGNLGRDPEVRRMNNGESVVNFSIATSDTWRDKATGERKVRTEWHNIVIFNENLGKIAEQYLKKGSKVYVEGALQTRKYTDKAGVEKLAVEVVLQRFRGELTLLDGRQGGGAMDDDSGYGGGQVSGGGGSRGGEFGRSSPMDRRAPAPAGGGGGRPSNDLDDDIPF
jgi:single-strand DNA-binding protein